LQNSTHITTQEAKVLPLAELLPLPVLAQVLAQVLERVLPKGVEPGEAVGPGEAVEPSVKLR
jgi:hypothetical protein